MALTHAEAPTCGSAWAVAGHTSSAILDCERRDTSCGPACLVLPPNSQAVSLPQMPCHHCHVFARTHARPGYKCGRPCFCRGPLKYLDREPSQATAVTVPYFAIGRQHSRRVSYLPLPPTSARVEPQNLAWTQGGVAWTHFADSHALGCVEFLVVVEASPRSRAVTRVGSLVLHTMVISPPFNSSFSWSGVACIELGFSALLRKIGETLAKGHRDFGQRHRGWLGGRRPISHPSGFGRWRLDVVITLRVI